MEKRADTITAFSNHYLVALANQSMSIIHANKSMKIRSPFNYIVLNVCVATDSNSLGRFPGENVKKTDIKILHNTLIDTGGISVRFVVRRAFILGCIQYAIFTSMRPQWFLRGAENHLAEMSRILLCQTYAGYLDRHIRPMELLRIFRLVL